MTKENGLKRLNDKIKELENVILDLKNYRNFVCDTNIDMYEKTITNTIDKEQYICCLGEDLFSFSQRDMLFAPQINGIYTITGRLNDIEKQNNL